MVKDGFSLMRGGPTYRIVRAIDRRLPGGRPEWLLTALLLLVSFAPMAWLAWRDGTLVAGRVDVPLLGDWFVLARFLVAMPLLVLAAPFSDGLVRNAMRQFFHGGVVPQGARPRFERVLAGAYRARDAHGPELACLALAFLPALVPMLASQLATVQLPGFTTWRHADDGGISPAGAWLAVVAAPVFRFLVLLWLWRLLLWSWLLWRFSRMDLDLRPTHPDGAGGLAFLGLAQCRFAVLSAAGAIVLCGHCVNQMLHAGQSAYGLRYLIAGYALGSTVVLMAPLLLMSMSLARARRHAFARYDALGHGLARAFDQRWKRGGPPDDASSLLESPTPSALADFSGVYANIVGMSIVPASRWNILRMLLAALAPFAPLAFIAMSLDELAQKILAVLM